MTKWKTAPVTAPGGLTARMLDDLRDAVVKDDSRVLWRPMTPNERRSWTGHMGNAKARRRWRRRHLPNTQRAAETQ